MLVHQRHAHLLDRDLAEDGHHLPGVDADVRLSCLGHGQRPCLPVRKMRKFSQMAMRMIAPVTIGARNGETWERISPLPMTATVSAAEQCAGHRAATAEQAGAAEHDGGDHVELEADAGVGRTAAEPGGDDDAGQRRRGAADHIDHQRDASGVDAGPAHRLGVGADAGDVAAEGGLVEDDVADDKNRHRKDRRQRHAGKPAAADLVEGAVGIDGDRIAAGEEERQAADHAEPRQRDDEGRDALIGDEEALHDADGSCRRAA